MDRSSDIAYLLDPIYRLLMKFWSQNDVRQIDGYFSATMALTIWSRKILKIVTDRLNGIPCKNRCRTFLILIGGHTHYPFVGGKYVLHYWRNREGFF